MDGITNKQHWYNCIVGYDLPAMGVAGITVRNKSLIDMRGGEVNTEAGLFNDDM